MTERELERWEKLCAQAAIENVPKKLINLTTQINRVLERHQRRIEQDQPRKTA